MTRLWTMSVVAHGYIPSVKRLKQEDRKFQANQPTNQPISQTNEQTKHGCQSGERGWNSYHLQPPASNLGDDPRKKLLKH